MKLEELSPMQQRMLRYVSREPYEVQIAGKNRAPHCSACRALVRKGLVYTIHTGCYGATEAGRAIFKDWCERTGKK